MPEISISFRMPDVRLQPFVSTYYQLDVAGDELLEDYLHPEWANLRMALDAPWQIGPEAPVQPAISVMQGPTSKPTLVRGKGSSFGIGILPTGWHRLSQANARDFADRIVPLAMVLGDGVCRDLEKHIRAAKDMDERKAIADEFLLPRMTVAKPDRQSERVERLLQLLNDPANATVEQLTEALGLPRHGLARLSKKAFGFPPKLLLRRQRFLRMLGALHARPYSEWPDFIDPQYVDQSHMLRDFRYFMGMTPKAYFAMPRPILAVAAKARAEMFGQPLQGLHGAGQSAA